MKIRYIKNIALSCIAASVIFVGCGSDGIDKIYALPDTQAVEYTLQVVDDDVLGAIVSTNECTGFVEKSNGYYTLTGCSSKPKSIIASGGIFGNEGSLIFELEGKRAEEAYKFVLEANSYKFDKKAQFQY